VFQNVLLLKTVLRSTIKRCSIGNQPAAAVPGRFVLGGRAMHQHEVGGTRPRGFCCCLILAATDWALIVYQSMHPSWPGDRQQEEL
jgi:hypothetical protein